MAGGLRLHSRILDCGVAQSGAGSRPVNLSHYSAIVWVAEDSWCVAVVVQNQNSAFRGCNEKRDVLTSLDRCPS
jgi:hypothetical protein